MNKGFVSVAVFDKKGRYVGAIAKRSYGTHFFAALTARGRALILDGIEGEPEELIARMRAEGFKVGNEE